MEKKLFLLSLDFEDVYIIKATDEEIEELESYIDDNDLYESGVEVIEGSGTMTVKQAISLLKDEYESSEED